MPQDNEPIIYAEPDLTITGQYPHDCPGIFWPGPSVVSAVDGRGHPVNLSEYTRGPWAYRENIPPNRLSEFFEQIPVVSGVLNRRAEMIAAAEFEIKSLGAEDIDSALEKINEAADRWREWTTALPDLTDLGQIVFVQGGIRELEILIRQQLTPHGLLPDFRNLAQSIARLDGAVNAVKRERQASIKIEYLDNVAPGKTWREFIHEWVISYMRAGRSAIYVGESSWHVLPGERVKRLIHPQPGRDPVYVQAEVDHGGYFYGGTLQHHRLLDGNRLFYAPYRPIPGQHSQSPLASIAPLLREWVQSNKRMAEYSGDESLPEMLLVMQKPETANTGVDLARAPSKEAVVKAARVEVKLQKPIARGAPATIEHNGPIQTIQLPWGRVQAAMSERIKYLEAVFRQYYGITPFEAGQDQSGPVMGQSAAEVQATLMREAGIRPIVSALTQSVTSALNFVGFQGYALVAPDVEDGQDVYAQMTALNGTGAAKVNEVRAIGNLPPLTEDEIATLPGAQLALPGMPV